VPCRLERHGGLITVANPDGKKSIGDLLVETAGKIADSEAAHSAITAMLSTGSAGLVNLTLVLNGLRVAGACVEIGGVEYRGDEAARALREHASLVPMWGLMEAVSLSPEEYNGFFSVYGDASLSRPRHLYWVAGFEDDEEQKTSGGEGAEASPPEDALGDTALAVASLESPALFMAQVVLYSRIIKYSKARDPVELHKEARQLSLDDPEGLYRLLVYLKNDDTISTFYMNGKPCLMVRMGDRTETSKVLSGDVIEILGDIDARYISYVSLEKVECPECVEMVRKACLAAPQPRSEEKPREARQTLRTWPSRKAKEKEAKNGGAEAKKRRFLWFRR